MNVFRILADVSHTLSKCILIFAIHRNRSAEGVSLITQALYAAVFCTRYLDIFVVRPSWSYWNFVLKIFYTLSSFYILFIMTRVYARTREREKAWRLGGYCLGGSMVAAPIIMIIFRSVDSRGFLELLDIFSVILESVCILPQLLLLRQTTVPTVIDSYYLVALGVYRALYLANWAERDLEGDTYIDPIKVIFGIVQTILYLDFAWVYYSRQRVKLRSGGIVDSDDFKNSWLINKIFGKRLADDEESTPALGDNDTENGNTVRPAGTRAAGSRWGAQGVSVSADDSVLEHERQRQGQGSVDPDVEATDEPLKDPDEMVLDDDEDEEEAVLTPPSQPAGIGGGEEWRS